MNFVILGKKQHDDNLHPNIAKFEDVWQIKLNRLDTESLFVTIYYSAHNIDEEELKKRKRNAGAIYIL